MRWAVLAVAVVMVAGGAAGQPQDGPGGPGTQQSPVPGAPDAAPQTSAGQAGVLGTIGGLRTVLGRYGVSLGLQESSEVFGNATGGVRRGAAYGGLAILSLGVDTGRARLWPGGTLNVSALQIHGRNFSADNLPALQTTSGIEAARATRLWEAWVQQSFLGGRLDVKLGQQSADQEFMTSQYEALFLNTAMGWPVLPSVNLYAGGPAYPLASLGVRVRGQPVEGVTVLAGVFDDNPVGGRFFDTSQVRGAAQSGTTFHTGTGALVLAEVQYAPPGAKLPGVYKLGGWYDTGTFYDQRFDAAGLSLADEGSGMPRGRRGNFSVYGVVDRMVWRRGEGPQAVGVFLRVMGGPGDRNVLRFSANGGVTMRAPFASRPDDSVGVGFGVARVSGRAIQLDQDRVLAGPYPVRGTESFVEVTYQLQATPWWVVQPDAQYVFVPGGGISNPRRPGQRVGDAAVVGVRTTIVF